MNYTVEIRQDIIGIPHTFLVVTDAWGNGTGAAVVFATLTNKPTDLTYQDFVVV